MPFSTDGMNWRGIDAADDRVLELEPLAARLRVELDVGVAVLAVPAGLALELALRLRGRGDRLEVGRRAAARG